MDPAKTINPIANITTKEGDEITLSFTVVESKLQISINCNAIITTIAYETSLTFLELTKIHKFFSLYTNCDEILLFFDLLLKKTSQYDIHKENNIYILSFKPFEGYQDIIIPIPQKGIEINQIVQELCVVVNNRKKEIDQLKEIVQITNDCFNIFRIQNRIYFDALKIMISETKKVNFNLLYKASLHGNLINNLHSRCDGYGPTVTVVKTKTGILFGGFTSIKINSSGTYVKDPTAFVFNLTNNKKYNVIDNGQNNIGNFKEYTIVFGRGNGMNAFYIDQQCLNSGVFNVQNSPEFCVPKKSKIQEIMEVKPPFHISDSLYNGKIKELTGGDATYVDYEVYHVIMEE